MNNNNNNNNEKKVVDYFAIVGLDRNDLEPYPDITTDAQKTHYKRDPIVDLIIINKSLQEKIPDGYECITTTPSGYSANLHSKANELYLCFKRGCDKPPILDIGIYYDGENLINNCYLIEKTLSGASANLNTNNILKQARYVTFRRATEKAWNSLATVDICVIIKSKGEIAPHTYNEIQKNLSNNLFSATIHLCYRKALIPAKSIKYIPKVLLRYPQTDISSFKFPTQVSTFGLSMGALIESWPAKLSQNFTSYPKFSTFVLNPNDDGANITKIYGSCLTFYENFDASNLNEEQMKQLDLNSDNNECILKTNKCILLLSKHPFFESFEKFLNFLFKLCYSNEKLLIPIEHYISNFMLNTPFPTPQKPRVLIHLTKDDELSIYLPEENVLPQSGASFFELLKNLGPENSINVLLFVLLQKSIMLHSLKPALLTVVAEALTNIIFPFQWNYPYIPMLPLVKCDMIDAPGSFIFGMDTRYFDMFDPPTNVICIDLDTSSISWTEERRNINAKQLPKKPLNLLRNRLITIFNEIDLILKSKRDLYAKGGNTKDVEMKFKKEERIIEINIREAFLRFMTAILYNYRSYFLTGTRRPDIKAKDRNLSTYFDIDSFIRSRESSSQPFYKELVQTQLFNDFIINMSFLSELNLTLVSALEFFDSCSNRINPNSDKDDVRLLDANKFINDQTVVILPLEPNEQKEYCYNRISDLKIENFFECNLNKNNNDMNNSNANLNNTHIYDIPSTPMGVRSTTEKLQSQQKLESVLRSSKSWAYCLLSNSYALWFIYLPSYIESWDSQVTCLNNAFKVLVKMQKQLLTQPDEICYRVFMQLCHVYKLPTIAVKILLHMRKYKIEVNQITYSYYNKAIIESEWPKFDRWGKLRLLISIVKAFKNAYKERKERLAKINNNKIKNKKKSKNNKGLKKNKNQISCKKSIKSNSSQNSNNSKIIDKNSKIDNDQNNKMKIKETIKSNLKINGNNNNNNQSCSSRSHSITCSLSSINDNQDKTSIDKISRESGDSGACLNGDNCSTKAYPTSIEFFTNGSIDIEIKTVKNTYTKINEDVQRRVINNNLDMQSAKSSKYKPKDFGQIKKNRQLFDLKMKTKPSIFKRQSNNLNQNEQLYSNSICLLSVGILYTNNLNECDFNKISNENNKNELSNSINNSINCNNKTDASVNSINNNNCSQVDINLTSKLRKFQSDDSIYAKYITKLIDNNNIKNKFLLSKDTIKNNKESENSKILIEDKNDIIKNSSSKQNEILIDPLGAYLLNTTITTTNTNLTDKNNEEINKKEELFNYEPFQAERQREKEERLAHAINHQYCDNCSLLNGDNYEEDEDDEEQDEDDYDDDDDSYRYDEDEDDDDDENDNVDECEEEEEGNEDDDDDDDEESDEVEEQVENNKPSIDTELLNKYKNANKFFNSFVKQVAKVTTIELNNSLIKDMTDFTTKQFSNIKNIKSSISQQEIATKIKSGVVNTFNKNLISQFSGNLNISNNNNNSNNSLNSSMNHSYSFPNNIKNPSQKDNKSTDSISQGSEEDIEMPEDYEIDDIFDFDTNTDQKNILLNVEISSCNRCKNCDCLLFDEEIMSAWSANDSIVNIPCIYCKTIQAPNLYIRTKDIGITKYYNQTKNNDKKPNISSVNEYIVTYLSPLVLRKELEIIANNNELNINIEFFNKRPNIFWNLLWYFKRLQIDSELPVVLLNKRLLEINKLNEDITTNDNENLSQLFKMKDYNRVFIKCMWDEFKNQNANYEPYYKIIASRSDINNKNETTKPSIHKFVDTIINSIKNNNVASPIKNLLKERDSKNNYSIYREILFLSIYNLEREHIDTDAFDREYRSAYLSLKPSKIGQLKPSDKYPNNTSVWCRRLFSPLYL